MFVILKLGVFLARNKIWKHMNYKNNSNKWKPAQKVESRLEFPVGGHSGYFNGVGKKHYALINNKSNKYIFNPHQYYDPWEVSGGNQDHHNMSAESAPTPRKSRPHNPQQQQDSLTQLKRDFDGKRLQKPGYSLDTNKSYVNSYKLHELISQNKYYNPIDGTGRMLGPVEDMYDIVHSGKNKSMVYGTSSSKKPIQPYFSRIVSPTYISSKFEAA